MKNLMLYLIVIIGFILQSTILQFVQIDGVVINLILVMLVVISLQTNELYGGTLGLMLGILCDIYYSPYFGINSLIFMSIGFILGSISDNVYKFDFLTNLYFTIIGTLYFHGIYYIINFFLKLEPSSIFFMMKIIIIEMILNILILFPIIKFERFVFRRFKIKFE